MVDQRFQQQLEGLAREESSAGSLQFLSDVSRAQQAQVRHSWGSLPLERRRSIMTELVELAEMSVELDFTRVYLVALDDDDDEVQALAIEGLWENDSVDLPRRLVEKLEHSQSELVQVASVQSLARYTLRAAAGDLESDWGERLRGLLLDVIARPSVPFEVRRRAVEAVAVYPDDEAVQSVIADAYNDAALPMQASGLYAMGRNLDQRWLDIVVRELESSQAMLRYEAARASGELGSQRAVPLLVDMVNDPDREAQLAAVGALGKLGGRTAATVLRRLLQSDDQVLRDAAEEALDELNFSSNPLIVG